MLRRVDGAASSKHTTAPASLLLDPYRAYYQIENPHGVKPIKEGESRELPAEEVLRISLDEIART